MKENITLYERLGGESGIESIVLAFYARILADPELGPFFRHASAPSVERIEPAQTLEAGKVRVCGSDARLVFQ